MTRGALFIRRPVFLGVSGPQIWSSCLSILNTELLGSMLSEFALILVLLTLTRAADVAVFELSASGSALKLRSGAGSVSTNASAIFFGGDAGSGAASLIEVDQRE